jgi:transcriptional regulator GlxA family with amidase domain
VDVRVAIVMYPGVDDLDVFGPFEVLVNAAQGGAPIEVELVGAHDAQPVRTSHGAMIVPRRALVACSEATALVVPGGGWNDRASHGAWAEARRGDLPAVIAERHAGATLIASVCTGAGLVAAAGILGGRAVTTHHAARREVSASGARVLEARVVDDGDIVSAGGVTSGLDLALHLVERWFGAPLAEEIATEIEYQRQGPVVLGQRAARSA